MGKTVVLETVSKAKAIRPNDRNRFVLEKLKSDAQWKVGPGQGAVITVPRILQ